MRILILDRVEFSLFSFFMNYVTDFHKVCSECKYKSVRSGFILSSKMVSYLKNFLTLPFSDAAIEIFSLINILKLFKMLKLLDRFNWSSKALIADD